MSTSTHHVSYHWTNLLYFYLRLLINLMLQCIISFLKYFHWLYRWFTFYWNISTKECNHISIYSLLYDIIAVISSLSFSSLIVGRFFISLSFVTSSKLLSSSLSPLILSHNHLYLFWCSRQSQLQRRSCIWWFLNREMHSTHSYLFVRRFNMISLLAS